MMSPQCPERDLSDNAHAYIPDRNSTPASRSPNLTPSKVSCLETHKLMLMTFIAWDHPSTVIAAISVYKHLQHAAPNTVHRGTNRQLKRLQVKTAAVILRKTIPTNNIIYLFLYFPMNCFCNFFLRSAISFSSFTSGTGRKSQIRSFTRTISSQSFVNCR